MPPTTAAAKRKHEVRNNADSLVYQTEKMLKDQASSFSGSEKESVESDLKALKEALGGSDQQAIKAATERLATGVQELGKKLYEAAAANSAGPAGPAGGSGGGDGSHSGGAGRQGSPADDEVVDAEIVDEGGQA